MTLEEIIRALRGCGYDCAGNTCPYWPEDRCSSKMHMDAVALLEKQKPVPVKPDYNFDTGGRYGRCPVCKSLIRRQGVYCWSCGQMLRWEG